MQPVLARAVAAVGALADLDDVLAVGGDHDRTPAVLRRERRVVAGRQLEPLGVEDRDVRVEERDAEPHPLDFDRQPLTLLALDDEVILVLALDDAVDGDVERESAAACRTRCSARLLFDHRQRADPERAHVGDAGRGADAEGVFAEPAVRRDGRPSP